jgi:hypothetical protein
VQYIVPDLNLQKTLVIHFFGLLWIKEFISGICMMVIAGTVCDWYWSEDKGKEVTLRDSVAASPIGAAVYRTLRYHSGSVALVSTSGEGEGYSVALVSGTALPLLVRRAGERVRPLPRLLLPLTPLQLQLQLPQHRLTEPPHIPPCCKPPSQPPLTAPPPPLLQAALILTVLDFVNMVLKYVAAHSASLQKRFRLLKCILCCIQCALSAFNRCIAFISRNGLIIMAIKVTAELPNCRTTCLPAHSFYCHLVA